MDILYKEAQNLWSIIFHAVPLTTITKCSTLGIHRIYQLQRFEFLFLTYYDEYLCSSICVDTFLLSWFTHVGMGLLGHVVTKLSSNLGALFYMPGTILNGTSVSVFCK